MKKILLAIILAATPAFAQQHDPNNPDHWYDFYCCRLNDCAPVTSWEKVEDGWILTTKAGRKALLPKDYMNMTRISKKPSKDAEFHACIPIDMREASDGKGMIVCLYIPMNV